MFSLLLSVLVKVCSIKVEPTSVPLWTEEELESFVSLWLVILSTWIKTAMFLLYHSEGCNICEMVLHECYVNDLRTTTCSGMLGHPKRKELWEYILVSPVSTFRLSRSLTCILLVYILLVCLSPIGNSPSCTSSEFTLCQALKLKNIKNLCSAYSPPPLVAR
jgi:hypothetical protein